ncbi:putative sulfite oxidase [Escovopsis weberi]|uniref:Putative sulfite oxidase n=1 Tax=Escovopsis weberi TaxID=150374 RepID=A0A0M9VVT2_ESCWE|nr:putative sulfite oxidase [Escovopsis weberi]
MDPALQERWIRQPPNEWRLEQGMDPVRLGLRNQSGLNIRTHSPQIADTHSLQVREDAEVDDATFVVSEERQGWRGYVEWEDYPEKKPKARKRFSRFRFPPPPEFQLLPVPATNPVLEGLRWKLWHKAIGGVLTGMPKKSWRTVLEEKHKDMLHLLQFPYNGEPPKGLLTREHITPNSLHFVRNHGGIPDIDAEAFDLRLDGLCSGSRRVEQIAEFAGEGDEMINAPWAEGAIGTAKWTGVSLKKVIKHCGGLKDGAKHIELYGADTYFKGGDCMNYVVSVPWSKVKSHEVLLAWEMNGKPLPRIHGFPLRAVVMGYIGARSVKWLYRIKAIETPSRAPVQSREYLYFQQQ